MTKAALVGLASMVTVMGSAMVPDLALADGKQGFKGHSHNHKTLHSTPPKRFDRPFSHHNHHGFNNNKGFRAYGVPYGSGYGYVAPSTVIYSAPAYVAPPPAPVYAPTPPAYAPPPVSSAPSPTETVIEFPEGRYELRGDGATTPYRWVWVPNPPAAPPSEVMPRSAPKSAPEPARRIDVFRWTDEAGVVHLTDRLDKVPEAYRAKVTKSQS